MVEQYTITDQLINFEKEEGRLILWLHLWYNIVQYSEIKGEKIEKEKKWF